jgi:hypothetical protein
MMASPFLQVYESDRGPAPLGTLWTLRKGARLVKCDLRTHPLGWEVVGTLDGELSRAEVVRDAMRVLDLAAEWRTAWEAKGWAVGSRAHARLSLVMSNK